MNMHELIKNRRSIRKFKNKPIDYEDINKILEAGRWAPSGLNNQPWRFYLPNDAERQGIAEFTNYSHIIKNSKACICVYLDTGAMYDRTKDVMAVGACIQNMLLAAEELELSTCWLGEILNRKEEVNKFLNIPEKYELMAVIALGYGDETPVSERKPINELMLD